MAHNRLHPARTAARLIGLVLLLAAFPAGALAQWTRAEVRCAYTKRERCSPAGCEEQPLAGDYLIVPSLQALRASQAQLGSGERSAEVRRCDPKECIPVEVATAEDGVYLDVWGREGNGYMIKFVVIDKVTAARRGDFVEVATSFLDAYIFYGHCGFSVRE